MIILKEKVVQASVEKASVKNGFTLFELIVSISIFAFMTAFLVAKYGGFNQSVLITNSAYDLGLTIRMAQSYGVNVRQSDMASGGGNTFGYPYAAHFSNGTGGGGPNNILTLFADASILNSANPYTTYDSGDVNVSQTTMRQGSVVSKICVTDTEADCSSPTRPSDSSVDISFKRPDPSAIITVDGNSAPKYAYVKITILAPNGNTKSVVVRSTGQIAIID